MKIKVISALILILAVSCGGNKTSKINSQNTLESSKISVPVFNPDSAFSFIKTQTDFGPRVPNTEAHRKCAEWLEDKLKSLGAKTTVQNFETVTFDNTRLNCYNIIGSYNPQIPTRIILCSHWDSRPWADNDPVPENRKTPVDAANDGASGVGVILEIARQMQSKAPEIGVDCIFFDAEDWGPGDDYRGNNSEKYWGLGTQYWASNFHEENYKARYAVLLDMVGGKGARFCIERYSEMFAKGVTEKVWNAASDLGHGTVFLKLNGVYVTDDHYFINTIAKIPAIDIVPYIPNSAFSSFGPTWHTLNDNIDNIDKDILRSVGETLLYVIYNEKK